LLKHKADPSVRDTVWFQTPLSQAADLGNVAIVTALVQAGAKDVDATLLAAVQQGRVLVLKAILEHGKIGPETLSAAQVLAQPDSAEVAELLRKAGAEPAPPDPPPGGREALAAHAGEYE